MMYFYEIENICKAVKMALKSYWYLICIYEVKEIKLITKTIKKGTKL